MADGESLKRFFKQQASRFRKCLEPSMSCDADAIQAHSIQNARVFDLLSVQNHVMMFKQRFSKNGPTIELVKIGRNKASTFTGFCARHDTEIFRRLDTEKFDVNDREMLFLLAYRSVTRELHATMEAAVKIQGAYQDRVGRGLDDGSSPSPAGMQAVTQIMTSFKTYQYRHCFFDRLLIKREYDQIHHVVINMEKQPPVVAASCLFSLDEVKVEDDCARVILNVFPLSTDRTVAVFSFVGRDEVKAKQALDRVLSSQGDFQKYELSKLLIEQTENFAFSPRSVGNWSAEKRTSILSAFQATLFQNGIEENENLMLF